MIEIRRQRTLRQFGSFLGLSHVLTVYFWLTSGFVYLYYMTDPRPVCWPFLPACENAWRPGAITIFVSLLAYLAVSLVATILFHFRRYATAATVCLLIATLLKLLIFLLDYRLSGNYHYMHFWILAGYFFIPRKADTLRFLLVLFYFAAGMLKLNQEWLSGAAIYTETFLSPFWLKIACHYVVVLELLLVFGLLSPHRVVMWVTLAQLAAFHLFSIQVVGFYYPAMQFCFLSLFVIGDRFAPASFSYRNLALLPTRSRAFLIVFLALQIVPWFLGGDPALDRRGRLFSLHMFDANPQCAIDLKARYQDHEQSIPAQYAPYLQVRLACDPYIMIEEARRACAELKGMPGFIDLDVDFRAKRATDQTMREIFKFSGFCTNPKRMDPFGYIH